MHLVSGAPNSPRINSIEKYIQIPDTWILFVGHKPSHPTSDWLFHAILKFWKQLFDKNSIISHNILLTFSNNLQDVYIYN